jgi:hypothetical protein
VTVSGFCPDGYVPTPEAIVRGMRYWYAERVDAVETAAAGIGEAPASTPLSGTALLARALSQPSILDASRHELTNIVTQTVHRLRNLLHEGKLKAYYFGDGRLDGRQAVKPDFWATPEADLVLESGSYLPFGRPNRWNERRPSYPFFLPQVELDAQLSEQQTAKTPFPEAKKPALLAAIRRCDNLPREEQRRQVRDLPEFRQYRITDKAFIE